MPSNNFIKEAESNFLDEFCDNNYILELLAESFEPAKNPPCPKEGKRKSYAVTFDYAKKDTARMLDVLRRSKFYALKGDNFLRTIIICRTLIEIVTKDVLAVVTETLEEDGSAVVSTIDENRYFWPEKPLKNDKKKTWMHLKP